MFSEFCAGIVQISVVFVVIGMGKVSSFVLRRFIEA